MPRNKPVDLTPVQMRTSAANRAMLSARQGERVTLDYDKRDGTPSTVSGEVVECRGSASSAVVVLLTDKGERSPNLWLIKAIH